MLSSPLLVVEMCDPSTIALIEALREANPYHCSSGEYTNLNDMHLA